MESSPSRHLHHCPTRADGVEALISQTVTTPMCQDRQRGSYHKCWKCAFRNGAAFRRVPVLKLTPALGRPSAEAV
jgi:hypothetical protein